MQAYLDGDTDHPTNQDIWGYNQAEGYSLSDLNKWVAEKKKVKGGKDKGTKPSDANKSKRKKDSDGKKETRK